MFPSVTLGGSHPIGAPSEVHRCGRARSRGKDWIDCLLDVSITHQERRLSGAVQAFLPEASCRLLIGPATKTIRRVVWKRESNVLSELMFILPRSRCCVSQGFTPPIVDGRPSSQYFMCSVVILSTRECSRPRADGHAWRAQTSRRDRRFGQSLDGSSSPDATPIDWGPL